jgi:hypothetical protein
MIISLRDILFEPILTMAFMNKSSDYVAFAQEMNLVTACNPSL